MLTSKFLAKSLLITSSEEELAGVVFFGLEFIFLGFLFFSPVFFCFFSSFLFFSCLDLKRLLLDFFSLLSISVFSGVAVMTLELLALRFADATLLRFGKGISSLGDTTIWETWEALSFRQLDLAIFLVLGVSCEFWE